MAYYAKVLNGVVTQVIVADAEFMSTFVDETPGQWIETDKNAALGQGLRKNFAGIGFQYDAQKDAFIPSKPFKSWVLNEEKFFWEAPVAYPDDGKNYKWDEQTTSWQEFVAKE